MNKEEKIKVVEDLKNDLVECKTLYLTDIAGLDGIQTSKLRRECFNSNVKLSVVKNTFLHRAMEESGVDFGELKEHLKGNTSIMFSDYGNAPAKVIKKFRKDGDKPILKGAFINEAIYIGDEQIDFLSTLKSKEEIIGEIKNVISALKSGGGKIAGLVKTLKEKPAIEEPVKEESKAEEPVKEESKAEEPVKEESKAEEPVKEEPKAKKKNEPKDEDS